ncbi:MAG: hypothetical protein J6M18_04860 [Actinomycetaceae bacterium]|nr:hypothetical protein [Actinomycetaceae bacterium]
MDTLIVDEGQGDSILYETRGLNWKKFKSCMNSYGVSNWALGVLGVVCGTACVGTAGAGCYACLFGASFGYGLQLGICLGKAWF